MSDLPPLLTADEDAPDVTAAELALGILDGDERAAAIRRVLAEPDFARQVERWRAHLAQLYDVWPGIAAPDVFDRVARSIDGPPSEPRVRPGSPAPSRLWPGLAAFSSIAAAALLVVLVMRPVPVPPAPPPVVAIRATTPTLVASIDPAAKGTPVTAVYDAATGAIRLTEAALASAGHSAELWVIAGDGTPHSLGLLHAHGTTALTLSPENRARIAAGATLAVSLEPPKGSPTGVPTGPVVATGALLTI